MSGKTYSRATNTGFGSHVNGAGKGHTFKCSAGQINHVYCDSNAGNKNEKTNVHRQAPMKPSHVLLGDSCKNGALINFRPKLMPTKYADTSFMMTQAMGKKNQKIPLRVLEGKYLH